MPSSRLERLFDGAMQALRRQRYNRAFDLFTEAMEIDPEMPEIHYNLGVACAHLYRWRDAETYLRMALRIRQDPDYWVHLGLVRLHLREWDAALADFDHAIAMDAASKLALLHRRDLQEFLARPARARGEQPSLCTSWFDPRLDEYVGVDPDIVVKAERVGLRQFVGRMFAAEGGVCDHTHRYTEEWALRHGRDPLGVSRFLFDRGMRCDCQVLAEAARQAT